MDDQRLIIEMGQGVDLHGLDATKAACRAVEDAMRGSSLPIFGEIDVPREAMRVQVTIGAPEPNDVNIERVCQTLPYGQVTVTAVSGGMIVPMQDDPVLMVMATVEVFLPMQTNWRLRSTL